MISSISHGNAAHQEPARGHKARVAEARRGKRTLDGGRGAVDPRRRDAARTFREAPGTWDQARGDLRRRRSARDSTEEQQNAQAAISDRRGMGRMIVLDTNVVSEFAKPPALRNERV